MFHRIIDSLKQADEATIPLPSLCYTTVNIISSQKGRVN